MFAWNCDRPGSSQDFFLYKIRWRLEGESRRDARVNFLLEKTLAVDSTAS